VTRLACEEAAVTDEDSPQHLHRVQHRLCRRVGVILLLGRRRLDAQSWNTLRLVCSGWWMGWTSATIARIGYPPAPQLTPAGEKRLRVISSMVIALGLASIVRMFAAGKRPPGAVGWR
jgi:hypothetical protein